MVDVVVFHHVQGLTPGVEAFADDLRREGHRVETPDLFGGLTFDTIADGIAFVGEIGRDAVVSTAEQAAAGLARDLVYVGFSLGARPAQLLAQTTHGARGALLLHGCHPTATFGPGWPDGVGLQVHLMDDDEWCDVGVAEALRDEVDGAEVFVYPGSAHLFTDRSVDDFEPTAARLAIERSIEFLTRFS